MKIMQKTGRLLITLLIMLTGIAMCTIPAAANSAPSDWTGTTSSGAVVTDEDCPITVSREDLTFKIQEFPEFYGRNPDISGYTAEVSAQYVLNNPEDYEVSAKLLFPFGEIPEYLSDYTQETDELIDRYGVQVDGEDIDTVLRHSYFADGETFSLEKDMGRFADEYLEDSYYKADMPVKRYTFAVSGISDDENARASITLEKSENFRVAAGKAAGVEISETEVTLVFDSEEEIILDIIGEYEMNAEWHIYDADGETENTAAALQEISCEDYTLKDYLMQEFDEQRDVSETDWYNAMVQSLRYHESDQCLINDSFQPDIYDDLMCWYEYEISIAAHASIVNTVTAPLFPSYSSAYSSTVYTYTYLLSPAEKWADFADLSITVETPFYMTKCSLGDMEKTDNGYMMELSELPDKELVFRLSEEENPSSNLLTFIKWIIGGAVVLVIVLIIGIILIVLAVRALIRLFRRKQ